MQSKRCSFSVDNVNIVEENSNSQFATLEVDVCRSGENSHNMPILRSAIEQAASSVKGKPILAAFQFADTDFAGHEIDEQPVGFFVEEEPELVEKDYHGNPELYIRAKGKVWKRYFENAMEIFKRKSGKTDVSMEIDMLDFEEPDQGRDGVINLFSILGHVRGLIWDPSVFSRQSLPNLPRPWLLPNSLTVLISTPHNWAICLRHAQCLLSQCSL